MKNMRNMYIWKNHPHFCPRKNGDSCRPVLGFYRLKRELHTYMFIPISPTGLLRLFPCSLRVLFLSFSYSSRGVRVLFSSCGCRFDRFPVPVSDCFLAVFSPLGRRFPPFSLFPVRSPPCRRLPWCCALLLSVCSRLVSRLVLRAVWRGGCACSVVWGFVPWRGVAWVGGASCRFCLASRSLSVRGEGRFGWFFHMELSGGLFEEE